MPIADKTGPKTWQVNDAMIVIRNALSAAKHSSATKEQRADVARLIDAVAPITKLVQPSHADSFDEYKFGIAIEDANQIMREIEQKSYHRSQPSPFRRFLGRLTRKSEPQRVIYVYGAPANGKGTRITPFQAMMEHVKFKAGQ